MKTILSCLCNHFFHAVAKNMSSKRFIIFDVVQRNITEGTLAPIAAMRHGEFVPSSITPKAVHGIDDFDG